MIDLRELKERLAIKADALDRLAATAAWRDPSDVARLIGKAEGVRLAIIDIETAERIGR